MKKSIMKKGDRFRMLTAIKFVEMRRSQQYWLFKCDCGNEKVIRISHIKRGDIKSCGCSRSKTHGMTKTKTYNSWSGMKARCLNKNQIEYKNYGNRGITICPEWLTFQNFYKDMGDKPKGKSLDRIDNNKGYSKENCRWATGIEQCNNMRKNRFITFKDKTQTIAQWARELNIDYNTFYRRQLAGK